MALSNEEKQRVIEHLDNIDDQVRRIVLATLEAFEEWLKKNLYKIFIKIAEGLVTLWRWLCSYF